MKRYGLLQGIRDDEIRVELADQLNLTIVHAVQEAHLRKHQKHCKANACDRGEELPLIVRQVVPGYGNPMQAPHD